MKLLRFVLRLMLVVPLIVFGLLCVGLVSPLLRPKSRAGLNRTWSRCLRAWISLPLQVWVVGSPPRSAQSLTKEKSVPVNGSRFTVAEA